MLNPLRILRIDTRQANAESAIAKLREKLSLRGDVVSEAGRSKTIAVFGEALTPNQVVEKICSDVRRDGLAAVLSYGAKLDGASLSADSLRTPIADLKAAHEQAAPQFLRAIRQARDNIYEFQSSVLPKNAKVSRGDHAVLEQRYLPLKRIGCCIPGGAAAYPSTILMTVVCAQAAGVEEIVVVSPPTKNGAYHPDFLATCYELGVTEVYRMGGAQAVAALAYGVEGIPRVDKIVGPGNLFVTLAKKHVYGDVDIDSLAGPSEIVVLADRTTPARYVASDLLAQAEHSPGAAILIAWEEGVVEAIEAELTIQLQRLDRRDLTATCLEEFGCLIGTHSEEEACRLANLFASEHLHIATENAEHLASKIRNVGALFLGPFSPVAVGDYIAGPSHVLPTGGTARFASGLNANSFLRSYSVIRYSKSGLGAVASDLGTIAEHEGLTAHRDSVRIRGE